MLSPEVLNFNAPESIFQSQIITKENCSERIDSFNYTHIVSVVLPDTLNIPESLTVLLSSCDYYKVNKLTLDELVNKNFISSFVTSGRLSLLSVDTRIDCDNCIAITASGILVLSLTKETFQSLGIEGKLSNYHLKTRDRYIVTIDLKFRSFKQGKLNYERLKSCLGKLKNFDVIINWDPPSKDICPSSVAKYFSEIGYDVNLCRTKHHTQIFYSVDTPIVDFKNFDETDCYNFAEWLGMVALEGNFETNEPGNYLSSYQIPEPNTSIGQVKFLQWRGFFTSYQIGNFFNELTKLSEKIEKIWSSMYIQGFSDSPVTWGTNEHHYYTNADTGCIFIFDSENYLICTQKCSNKRYKNLKRK